MCDLKTNLINWYETKDSDFYILTLDNDTTKITNAVNEICIIIDSITDEECKLSANELIQVNINDKGFYDKDNNFLSIKDIVDDLDMDQIEYISETLLTRPILINKDIYM